MSISLAVCERMIKRAIESMRLSPTTRHILQREQRVFVSHWFEDALHSSFSLAILNMIAANRHTVLLRDVPVDDESGPPDLDPPHVPRAGVYAFLKRFAAESSSVLSKLRRDRNSTIRLSSSVVVPLINLAVAATIEKITAYMSLAIEAPVARSPVCAQVDAPQVKFGAAASDQTADRDTLPVSNATTNLHEHHAESTTEPKTRSKVGSKLRKRGRRIQPTRCEGPIGELTVAMPSPTPPAAAPPSGSLSPLMLQRSRTGVVDYPDSEEDGQTQDMMA